MSLTLEAAPERVARVLAAFDAALADDPGLALGAASARMAIEFVPAWPPLALPLTIGPAFGLAADACEGLATAGALFFAAADVIDEAQDGELDPAAWPAWEPAIAAGFGLLFRSQQLALAAVPDAARGPLAAAYAEAGVAMSRGQWADLAARGMPADGGGEAAYLECVKGKTGAAIGLYAAAGAIAAGAPPAAVEALTAWGRAAGGALQLASDLADVTREESRDQAAMRPTLPIIRAWNRLGEADRPLLTAAWRGDPGAPALLFVLQRTGALTYARTRLDALRVEAELALEAAAEAGDLPAPLVAALNGWMVELVLGQEPPPV